MGYNIDDSKEQVQYQQELYKLAEGRIQLTGVQVNDDYCKLFFGDTEVPISFHFSAFLQIADSKQWMLGHHHTDVEVLFDELGVPVFPDIEVSPEGTWIVDSLDTGIEAHCLFLDNPSLQNSVSLLYLAYADNWIEVCFTDGFKQKMPIVSDKFFIVPDYFMTQMVDKEKKAAEIISQSEDYSHFVFFTDAHWGANGKHSPAIIKHVIDYTSAYDVFFGGDVITTYTTNIPAALAIGGEFQESFSFLGPKFMCVYGNHDNNSDSQPSKDYVHLSEEQVISYLQSQMTEVDDKSGYNFYYDDSTSCTRYIGLDTGRYYYSQFRDTAPETARYAIESLKTVPEGWHVVIVTHILLENKRVDGVTVAYISSFYKGFTDIFDNFNSRSAGKYSYKSTSIEYDFSSASGKVEFCIAGHNHYPRGVYSEGGIPVILCTTDSRKVVGSEKADKGTINEQSVSIVVADYTNSTVNVLAIGRGEDRTFELH